MRILAAVLALALVASAAQVFAQSAPRKIKSFILGGVNSGNHAVAASTGGVSSSGGGGSGGGGGGGGGGGSCAANNMTLLFSDPCNLIVMAGAMAR